MFSPQRLIIFIVIIWAMVVIGFLGSPPIFAQQSATIQGVVQNEDGPFAGATVRIQATDQQTITAEDGTFTLSTNGDRVVTVVAAAKGYFLGWVSTKPDQAPIQITLNRHHRSDNLDYQWEPSINCGECHTAYLEWQADAHGNSATNPRFLSLYNGTDIKGNRSPNTGYDAGFPTLPDLSQPYFGPGFKIDFPERDGNCAACHTPLASNLATTNTCGWSGCHRHVTAERSDELPESVSPVGLQGVAAEGISCDFCHKIGRVRLDKETGKPPDDRPGILSLSIYRPGPNEKLLFGSVNDVSREGDSYLPLQEEGAFCASCHYGVFSDTLIYNSYGEWLDSPYSDPQTGETCQDCHMPWAENYEATTLANSVQPQLPLIQGSDWALPAILPQTDKNYFVFPWKGGLYRDPFQVHSHRMPGASDPELLQHAVTLKMTADKIADEVQVSVNITNDKTGHHVPTGSPLRNMLLIIEAFDAHGDALPLIDGGLLPDWAGDYAGYAGKGYAKLLRDSLTGEMPTVAHWRLTDLAADTRIPAKETDTTQYRFAASNNGSITIEARLIYRRAFQQIAHWKGWIDPDIVMEEVRLEVGNQN